MLRKDFTLATRYLARHAGFSALAAGGFAVGLAACLLIGSYIGDELAYGTFHEDADRIYRVLRREEASAVDASYTSNVSGAVGPALAADFPEVEEAVRLINWTPWIRVGEQMLRRPFCQADVGVVDLFDVEVLSPSSAADLLRNPNTVLLSETVTREFFGEADPIGGTVTAVGGEYAGDYLVTGLFRDVPSKAHMRFHLLTAQPHSGASKLWMSAWEEWRAATSWRPTQVYVRLSRGADLQAIESRFAAFVEKYMGAEIAASNTYALQSLARIHLYSGLDYGMSSGSDIEAVRLLVAIGAMVLLISMFNYVNMATARSTLRAREVAQRKVLGARPAHLAVRYLLEGLLHGLVATTLAFGLAALFLPSMADLVARDLRLGAGGPGLLVAFAIGGPVIGVVAAAYPAAILARLSPVSVLKGSLRGSTAAVLVRRGLVVLQLVVTVGIIAGAVIVRQQLAFIDGRDIGYDPDSLVIVDIFGDDLMDRYKTVKQAFLQHPGVLQAAACWPHPAGWVEHHLVYPEGEEGETWRMQVQGIDEDFLETLGVELVAGRDLREDGRRPRQTTGGKTSDTDEFLLNETAVRALGWEDPIGKGFRWYERRGTVVGVVGDFHSKSMHSRVEPMFLCRWIYLTLILRISTEDVPGTVAFIEETWRQFIPELPPSFSFMDQRIEWKYTREVRLSRLYTVFGGLAIVIAAVGLVGLAAFTTSRRRQEVGVRKVLAATVAQVVGLLVWDVCRLVMVANLVAWPIAYFPMADWLEGFAYRTELSPVPFALAGVASMALACGAVARAAYRTATMNPAEALRTE